VFAFRITLPPIFHAAHAREQCGRFCDWMEELTDMRPELQPARTAGRQLMVGITKQVTRRRRWKCFACARGLDVRGVRKHSLSGTFVLKLDRSLQRCACRAQRYRLITDYSVPKASGPGFSRQRVRRSPSLTSSRPRSTNPWMIPALMRRSPSSADQSHPRASAHQRNSAAS